MDAKGGFRDFVGDYEDMEEARAKSQDFLRAEPGNGWYQIYDCSRREIVQAEPPFMMG